jgi:hypothetical protein
MIFSQQHFQYLSFTPNHEKNFRTFGHNYLKQRHFELLPKSGGFYSLRLDPMETVPSYPPDGGLPVPLSQISSVPHKLQLPVVIKILS